MSDARLTRAAAKPKKAGMPSQPRSETLRNQDIAPFEAWWTLMLAQIERLRSTLPRDLAGVVQFEARGDAPDFRFLVLDGPRTQARVGVAQRSDAWVELREADLVRFLDEGALPPGSMHTFGDAGLVSRLASALDGNAKKTGWLALRASESMGR